MENKHKGLSAWQITMMALGSIIGGSFFIGSAVAIRAVGPAIIVSYILGGILVYFILSALSEMTEKDPSPGSFRTFSAKAFGPSTGFIVGWVYWTGMILAMSSEAAALSILIRNWFPGVSISLFGSITIIGVTLLNLLGADKLSKFESCLVAFKLLTIVSFIIIGLLLIMGLIGKNPALGMGELRHEPLLSGGIKGIAGSMLTVMFAYAGFETIGLAAADTDNPRKVIPKAITYTVLSLVVLYIISVAVLLPLIPTGMVSENVSPMVAALDRRGINWVGNAINIVMFTAMLSTMLAAMFGLGRMIRSLADEGFAPKFLKDEEGVPYRGMIFSGAAMLLGLMSGLLFPRVYLFLVSAGGFALLFTYVMIVASQIHLSKRDKKRHGYASWFTLISLIIVIFSMPFIPGQSPGLIAGITIIAFYSLTYAGVKYYENTKKFRYENVKRNNMGLYTEFSKELTENHKNLDKNINEKDTENDGKKFKAYELTKEDVEQIFECREGLNMIKSIEDTVILNNGVKMPQHGFGVYLITDEKKGCEAIDKALEVGYRAFDTAQFYENEALLGKILSESSVKRSELFITTKVANYNQGYDSTLSTAEQSLKNLHVDQLDLLLIHWPSKRYFFETWKAMERLYDEKMVRAIGVCNFEIHHLEELCAKANVKPVVDQVECHPYLTQQPIRDYVKKNNIAFESWSPLGRGAVLHDTVLGILAEKYNKSVAQIIIRWHLQKGNIVIPKSITPSRVEENSKVYDFSLDESEVKIIDALNKDKRTGDHPDVIWNQI